MTEQQGSSLPRFKAALIEALQARVPHVVAYESPTDAYEIMGEDGSGQSVFWLDGTDAEVDVNISVGAGTTWWDETVRPILVLQCIGVDTDDTQSVLDRRAFNLLGHAVAILASDPTVGLAADSDSRAIRAIPESWTNPTGVDSQNRRGSRIELRITLEARVTVEATS